jgi:ribosome-associated protein
MIDKKSKFKKLSVLIANITDSKKAANIIIYDVSKKTSLTYYIVIMTAESMVQMKAIEGTLEKELKIKGFYVLYRDGVESRNWKILDYGGVIVHIFEHETRNFYALDRMYVDSKQVQWKTLEKKKKISGLAKKSGKSRRA